MKSHETTPARKDRGSGSVPPLIPSFDKLRRNGLIPGQDKDVCELWNRYHARADTFFQQAGNNGD